MATNKTAIVTGAQQGIGAGLVDGFLKNGYSVVATSLRAGESLRSAPDLVVVDGDIRDHETAAKSVEAAVTHFGTVDVLVNNAESTSPSLSRNLRRTTSTRSFPSIFWDSSI